MGGTVGSEEKSYAGIGGWLILVGVGLTFALIRAIYFIFTTYPPFFTNGILKALITPESGVYNMPLAIFVMGELVVNAGLMIASSYLLYLFMKRKANFPAWFIGVMAVNLVFMVLDPSIIKLIRPEYQVFDEAVLMSIARNSAVCLIWIPYMLRSKRVRATFIH